MIEIKPLIYNSATTICYGLLSIYIFFCIFRSVFKYRVYGLSLNLLIGLEIAVLAVVFEYAFYLGSLKELSDGPISSAQLKKLIAFDCVIRTSYGV